MPTELKVAYQINTLLRQVEGFEFHRHLIHQAEQSHPKINTQ